MLVSDEAPEATCLSILCGSFRRPVRRFFPTACVSLARRRRSSGQARGLTGRGSGCGSHLLAECLPEPGRWPGRFPPDGAPYRPGPSPGGCWSGHCWPGHHPRRIVRPAVWMFATALAPCLCASEARPSDRGIQVWRHPTANPSFQPHVRRETVAAGRDLAPATVLNPGAGPASPDIASSGVSEGGTAQSLREEKWAGMKKCVGV